MFFADLEGNSARNRCPGSVSFQMKPCSVARKLLCGLQHIPVHGSGRSRDFPLLRQVCSGPRVKVAAESVADLNRNRWQE